MSAKILATFRSISGALARAGVPPVSPYWDREAERFYLHPTARRLVECVGRGGDKSRTSTIMAIAEVLAGEFQIPPGERHAFAHISENRDEAAKTLSVLEQYLRILGIAHERTSDTIELTTMPRGFKVLACRVGAVSGWRCIGWTADECAKWSNDGADPTEEVLTSIGAMTVTHANARGRMISSPLANFGKFHEVWSAGETESTLTGHAPSWKANPIVTEAGTRTLEPNLKVWLREYGAIPSAGVGAALDADAVGRAFQPRPWCPSTRFQQVLIVDPSSGRSDGWTWCLAGWVAPLDGSAMYLRVERVDGIEGDFWQQGITGNDVVTRIAHQVKPLGIRNAYGDQREELMLTSAFRREDITYKAIAWTAASKPLAVERVRRWLHDGVLALDPHAKMRQQMLGFQERITSQGAFTYGARGSQHDDYVALLLTLALVEVGRFLPGSPLLQKATDSPPAIEGGFVSVGPGLDGSTIGGIENVIDLLSQGLFAGE